MTCVGRIAVDGSRGKDETTPRPSARCHHYSRPHTDSIVSRRHRRVANVRQNILRRTRCLPTGYFAQLLMNHMLNSDISQLKDARSTAYHKIFSVRLSVRPSVCLSVYLSWTERQTDGR